MIETISLLEFFDILGYDWKKDEKEITEICRITKTRAKDVIPEHVLSYGMEQTFLLKAISDYRKAKNILEIGTGRGTGSYAMSLTESVEDIVTLDIIPYDQKQNTAIGFQPAYASNADLFKLIPGESKEKIRYITRKSYEENNIDNDFDLAFIDGDHTNENVIREDFKLCKPVLDNDGVIIWDDYGQSDFAVKKVVDSISDTHDLLVEFRGHLFGGEEEHGSGIVLMTNGAFF